MTPDSTRPARAPRRPHPPAALALLALAGVALFALFAALGWWQLERRTWKLDLIARVERHLQAAPVALPAAAQWPQVRADTHEYQPVHAAGRWLADKTVLTQATTALGAGWWVLTPLQLADGSGQVLVNRGFIPQALRADWARQDPIGSASSGDVQVVGLLRMGEPGGGFLRRNAPAEGRWHSRDVQAIAQAQGLPHAAPFFIDQGLPGPQAAPDAPPNLDGPWPRAGLTVVRFHNSHLAYVLTWWGLAALVLVAAWLVTRYELRLRAAARPAP